MGHAKRRAARLLARQAASACGSESLRAATKFTGVWPQLPHTPRVDVAASPQLPTVGTRPCGAHACSCVFGEPERAEELGQQVRRQQDIHAPRWERRHLSDEGVGLVLELGRALAGVHGELQELRVRERGEARSAHARPRVTGARRRRPSPRAQQKFGVLLGERFRNQTRNTLKRPQTPCEGPARLPLSPRLKATP
eukprot:scaffold104211_cov69-Phaeocystis_antarctica.AAC.3